MKRPHSLGVASRYAAARSRRSSCRARAMITSRSPNRTRARSERYSLPQARDLRLDRGVLGYELRIVAERKRAKQLAAVLGELLDLGPYVI